MKPDDRAKLDRLHARQGEWQNELNALTSRMGRLAEGPGEVSQERWDRLFQAEENVRKAMTAMGNLLEEAAREAGVPNV